MNALRPPTVALWLAALALVPPRLCAEDPSAAPPPAPAAPAPAAETLPAGMLRFNFRNAPLEQVLNYLSDAAGFVIVLDTPVRGTVDMWSSQPVSRDEAVSLLNHALNKNGYTATLQGRSLVISSKETAKRQNIPVRTGNDPREIPPTADMVMQIIPLRQIGAAQAARDIATLIPESATITANEDSNSLVVTDTQINVRHIVEVVAQLDGSIASDSAVRVFHLQNADALETADIITNLFGTASGSGANRNNNGAPFNPATMFGAGGPGGFFGRLAAAQGGGRSGRNSRGGGTDSTARASVPVTAVADARTNSVIVTAAHDALDAIAEIVTRLDESGAQKQQVYVYTLENADVQQVETVLRNLFQSTTNRTATSSQPDALSARAASNTQQNSGSFLNNSSGPR